MTRSCAHSLTALVDPLVDAGDLSHPRVALPVTQREHLVSTPMEVVGDERYLLEDILKRVAHYSPRRPNSFSN